MRSSNQRVSRNYQIIDGEDFLKYYSIGKELGRSNARVFEAKNLLNSTKAAIKEIHLSDDWDTSTVKKEISLLKTIQEKDIHKYFVGFLNFCIIKEDVDNFNSISTAYILMEKGFCSLTQLIDSRKKNMYTYQYFAIDEVMKMCKHLIDSFAFLQKELNLSHCDIKPENLLLMSENELIFKICDVGAGEILMNDQQTKTKTIKGTIPFLAPELLGENLLSRKECNFYKADVFSLGLCFLFMITFKKFSKIDRQMLKPEIFEEILNEWIDEAFYLVGSEDLRTLLKEMLTINPKYRPDFKELQEKMLHNNLPSPTLSDEFYSKTNRTSWTANNEDLTSSYLANGEEVNSPEKKDKKFVIKKKSNDRYKSLHNMPASLFTNNPNNGTNNKNNSNNNISNAKEYSENNKSEDNLLELKHNKNSNGNNKSLSPVKIMKQPVKKFSVEVYESLEASPLSPEHLKKGRKTENLNSKSTNHKNFSIHLKNAVEELKTTDNHSSKKSIFSRKNTNKIDLSPKKNHQKFISNASDLVKFENFNTITTNEQANFKKNESAFVNKEYFSKDLMPTLKKNEGLIKNESLINLKNKKNQDHVKLPPLILPENSFNKSNLFALNLTPIKYINNIDELKSEKKNSFFGSYIQKKHLVTNIKSLENFLKNKDKFHNDNRNLNVVLDKKIDENDKFSILSGLSMKKNLEFLLIDIYFQEGIVEILKEILENNSQDLKNFILNYREILNNESPINFFKHNIGKLTKVNLINTQILSKNLNCGLLSLKNLEHLQINLEKIPNLQKDFSHVFSNISTLVRLNSLKISCRFLNFYDSTISEIFENVSELNSIEIFEFFCDNNHITEELFVNHMIFPKNLKKLVLNFSFNQINLSETKEFLIKFPNYLEQLSLDLEGVCLGNGLKYIGSSINKLNFVRSLNLNFGDSKLNSTCFCNFCTEISQLLQLEMFALNIKNNNINENSMNNLGKIIRTNFQNLHFLELNFLYIDLSMNTIKNFLTFANYMCYLKIEYFNLFLFRNITNKSTQEIINTNKESRFDRLIIYPDIKEIKIFIRFNREKKDSFFHVNKYNFKKYIN